MVTGLLYQAYLPLQEKHEDQFGFSFLRNIFFHAAPTKVFKKPQSVVTKHQMPTSILLL